MNTLFRYVLEKNIGKKFLLVEFNIFKNYKKSLKKNLKKKQKVNSFEKLIISILEQTNKFIRLEFWSLLPNKNFQNQKN